MIAEIESTPDLQRPIPNFGRWELELWELGVVLWELEVDYGVSVSVYIVGPGRNGVASPLTQAG